MRLVTKGNTAEISTLDDVFRIAELEHQCIEGVSRFDGTEAGLPRCRRESETRDRRSNNVKCRDRCIGRVCQVADDVADF
jgi:hypothetical protein